MSERESRDAARSVSVVHYMDRDLQAAAAIAAGLVERSGGVESGLKFVAMLPTADDALAFSEAVFAQQRDAARSVTSLGALTRSRRIIGAGTSAVAAAPDILARLLAESRLDLSSLHTLLLVWPEEILRDEEQRKALETLVAEIPRSAERVALCAERSAELAQFIERSMWRAREVEEKSTTGPRVNAPLRVITAPVSERSRAVRSVLDAFDPESAALLVFSDAAESAAREAAGVYGPSVDVVRGIPERHYALGILFDDVPDAASLETVSTTVRELVAVLRPSRLTALQKVAANVTPMTWTGALANARLTHDALRDEVRGYVASGGHTPWVSVLEPLLEGLDAVEVAAAAFALLDRERRKAKRTVAPAAAIAPAPERPAREERPMREDRPMRTERPVREDRPAREERGGFKGRPRGADDRGRPRGADDRARPRRDDDRGRPPERGFKKKREFGGDARKRDDSPRGPRRDFADRSREPRGRPREEIERVPRAAREGREWSERGERLRNSRKGPRSGDSG
jgi:hypothetical protein